ncbi:MAG TPA: hypothetical protein VGZ89_17785 [Xanthobacteraceae bacterium]|jgi:hypothetical protein|nr:hypothetical protein [Xanthobacteraceae bacterium]
MNITMTRREFAALAGAVVLSSPASAQTGEREHSRRQSPLLVGEPFVERMHRH